MLAAVAFASRRVVGARGPGAGADVARSAVAAVALGAALAVACVAVLVILSLRGNLTRDRDKEWVQPDPRTPWWIGLLILAVGVLVVAGLVISLVSLHGPASNAASSTLPAAATAGHATALGATPASRTGSGGVILGALIIAGMLLVVTTVGAVTLLTRRPGGAAAALETAPADPSGPMIAVVEQSLADLDTPGSPRAAVIRAYHRMERGLAGLRLELQRAETPREYQARVLAVLGEQVREIARITELYEEARFSTHPIGDQMRQDAAATLLSLRRRLQTGGGEQR